MKALKITINQQYLKGEEPSPEEIYEASRKDLPANDAYKDAEYAFIFAYCEISPNRFRGKSLALYKISPATWKFASDKCEFAGTPAEKDIAKKCVGKLEASRKKLDKDRSVDIIDLEVFMHFAHGVQKEHVVSALNYLSQKGQSDKHGVYYAFNKPHSTAVMDNNKKYAPKEVVRIAYCYKINDVPKEKGGTFSEQQHSQFGATSKNYSTNRFTDFLHGMGLDVIDTDDSDTDDSNNQPVDNDSTTQKKITESIELLRQFYQIILYGPPGTGKTHIAKKILPELLTENGELYDGKTLKTLQGEYWDIVQFHPSYNYEDFVRGIKVETQENQVAYKTVNRTFGEICERAASDENDRSYVLIIDEINRANVSAVLGELIYALEYRGKSIKTPYTLEGDGIDNNQEITIPKNLYVIGTMNTADRTIGQIDYAVRRRFAFVHCGPKSDIVQQKSPYALAIYDKTQSLFDKESGKMSSDFDAKDVKIGHSYFLPSDSPNKTPRKHVARKIIWQVVPVLREYVKDGVLNKDAIPVINEIKKEAEKLEDSESEDPSPAPNDKSTNSKQRFYWKKGDRSGNEFKGITAFSIIKDFIHQNPSMTYEQLAAEFKPVDLGKRQKRVALLKEAEDNPDRYSLTESRRIRLNDGNIVCISNQWGNLKQWNKFRSHMKDRGYHIAQYWIVNIPDTEHRLWEYCRDFGFVSAGGNAGAEIEKLQQGDLLFVFRIGSNVEPRLRGCVACGRVISDKAVDVWEIPISPRRKLKDARLKGGQTYHQKFSAKNTNTDRAVSVEWIPPPLDDNPITITGSRRGWVCISQINDIDFKALTNAFKIHSANSKI